MNTCRNTVSFPLYEIRKVVLFFGILASWSCSPDMETQPSYTSQEAPRRHSPQNSVPYTPMHSRSTIFPLDTKDPIRGNILFQINCSHCHGPHGDGDGPVAGYLPELPANLHASTIQKKTPEMLFQVITNGQEAMPAFQPYLSVEERWALVDFVHSLKQGDS